MTSHPRHSASASPSSSSLRNESITRKMVNSVVRSIFLDLGVSGCKVERVWMGPTFMIAMSCHSLRLRGIQRMRTGGTCSSGSQRRKMS